MKKQVILLTVFFCVAITGFSQKSDIYFSSKYDDFEVYVGHKEYSEGFDNQTVIKNIAPGKYTFRITFDNDTVADIIKKMKIKPNKAYKYEIKPKQNITKAITKVGRKVKNTDYNDNKLTDYYFLNLISIENKK